MSVAPTIPTSPARNISPAAANTNPPAGKPAGKPKRIAPPTHWASHYAPEKLPSIAAMEGDIAVPAPLTKRRMAGWTFYLLLTVIIVALNCVLIIASGYTPAPLSHTISKHSETPPSPNETPNWLRP